MKWSFYTVVLSCLLACISTASAEESEKIITDFTKFKTKLVKGENLVSKTISHKNGHNVVEFKYTGCKAGEYYAEFWMCPAKHKDGSIEDFSIMVNNILLQQKLKPTQTDWHAVSLENNQSITFKDGVNTIQIIGNGCSVPDIDVVEISPTTKPIKLDNSKYVKYKSDISNYKALNHIDSSTNNTTTTQSSNVNSTSIFPEYNFSLYNDMEYYYTFHKSFSLVKGEHLEVLVEGLEDFQSQIHFFKNSSPETYSWTIYPEEYSTETYLRITAPEEGIYTILLKPLFNAPPGYCNVLVNNDTQYENVIVNRNRFLVNRFKTDQEYNTFTYSTTGDPILIIESTKAAENIDGMTTKIEAYNDDGDGAYDEEDSSEWDLNARIKRKYDNNYKLVWITSYSSLNPKVKCDLYLNCRNAVDVLPCFKHLKADDAISSGDASYNYNCISWSGGITNYWEWPPSEDSQFYSENPLEAFDNFYNSRGLTREGANYYNGTVALWAYVYNGGERWYTHATIRNGNGDGIAHGYSWESKAGSLERFFHPRNAVGGYGLNYEEGYGEIVEYYRPQYTNFTLEDSSNQLAQPQPINISFNSDEEIIIKEYNNAIDSRIRVQFQMLYAKYDESVKRSIHSNPYILKNCDEFEVLMDYYFQHQECKYIIFDLLANNELAAILVMNEITNNDDILRATRKSVANKVRAANKTTEYYPIQSNMMLNVKEYLKDNIFENILINTPLQTEFNISVGSGQIKLESLNTFNNSISIEIYDQYGNLLDSKSDIQPVSNGKYIVSDFTTTAKGIVILKINTGDNIISKKLSL